MKSGRRIIRRTVVAALMLALAVFAFLPAALAEAVSGGEARVDRGKRVTLQLPQNEKNVTWQSADTAVATVDNRGRVTGRRAGSVQVTARTTGGREYVFTVDVHQPVTRVRLNPGSLTVETGQSAALQPTVQPDDATDKTLAYASGNPSVAVVDENGVVTGLRAGRANITAASANGKKATVKVTVIQPVTGVSCSLQSATVDRGRTVKLTAQIQPADASNKKVTWRSENPSVATVNSSGKVTGKKAGSTWIVLSSSNGLEARALVTVTQPVTRVAFSGGVTLEKGTAQALSPRITPDDATDKTLTYSTSNAAIAAVNESGVVTALGVGRATITAMSVNGKKATVKVTVVQPVTGVTLDAGSLTIDNGTSRKLAATVFPADATDKKLRWTSSDTSVVRVSSSGSVSARKAGVATVQAVSANGVTASCVVTVLQPVKRITLKNVPGKLSRGQSAQAEAVLAPADVSNRALTWESSDPSVASVDQNGLIRGVNDGKCVITVTAEGGKKATARVTVTSVKVKGVSLDRFMLSGKPGQTVALAAQVQPADAYDQGLTYVCDNPQVARVDGNGEVTMLAVGRATITVTTREGGYQAQCRVTVREENGKRLAEVTIGINPGHQIQADLTQDPIAPGSSKTRNRIGGGCRGVKTRMNEYEVNLLVGLKLRDVLEAEGARVVMTRTANDVYITNIQRAQMLNAAQVDLALQLHCDSSPSGSGPHGFAVYTRQTGTYAKESAEAGLAILDAATAHTGANRYGAKKSDNYMSLNWSTVPAVLVEMGFMSNPAEDVKLATDSYQQLLAEGIMEGICNWLGR